MMKISRRDRRRKNYIDPLRSNFRPNSHTTLEQIRRMQSSSMDPVFPEELAFRQSDSTSQELRNPNPYERYQVLQRKKPNLPLSNIPSLTETQIQPQPLLPPETIEKLRQSLYQASNRIDPNIREWEYEHESETAQLLSDQLHSHEYLQEEEDTKRKIDEIIMVAQALREKLNRDEKIRRMSEISEPIEEEYDQCYNRNLVYDNDPAYLNNPVHDNDPIYNHDPVYDNNVDDDNDLVYNNYSRYNTDPGYDYEPNCEYGVGIHTSRTSSLSFNEGFSSSNPFDNVENIHNSSEIPRLMDLKPKIPSLLDLQVSPPSIENVLKEQILIATSRFENDTGMPDTCWNCEQSGHKYKYCKKPKLKKFCFRCGRSGFDVSSCPYCRIFKLGKD